MVYYNTNTEEAENNLEYIYDLLADILIESEDDNDEPIT